MPPFEQSFTPSLTSCLRSERAIALPAMLMVLLIVSLLSTVAVSAATTSTTPATAAERNTAHSHGDRFTSTVNGLTAEPAPSP